MFPWQFQKHQLSDELQMFSTCLSGEYESAYTETPHHNRLEPKPNLYALF